MQQYDEEVEQIVIGSLIQNPKVFPEVSEIVKGEDFSEKNRLLFEAIAELTDQNENYDELILASYLKEKGLLDKIGGRSYVA
ncbi:MAG: replicative DNA helicase, partial [Candidatus Hydrogenedentota bacterium]